MATNHTTNYELNQWLPTDSVLRTDFNGDNAKVDAALKALSDQVVQKASQSAVNTLVTAVNQKANQTDLSAAVGRISALEGGKADQAALDQLSQSHNADVNTLRGENCWVKLGEVTLEAAAQQVQLPVSQISQMQMLLLEFSTTGADEITCIVQTQSAPDVSLGMGLRNEQIGMGRVEIFRAAGGRLAVFGRYYSVDGTFTFEGTPAYLSPNAPQFQDLTAVRVAGDADLDAGSRFVLYGLKR